MNFYEKNFNAPIIKMLYINDHFTLSLSYSGAMELKLAHKLDIHNFS